MLSCRTVFTSLHTSIRSTLPCTCIHQNVIGLEPISVPPAMGVSGACDKWTCTKRKSNSLNVLKAKTVEGKKRKGKKQHNRPSLHRKNLG
jgi:hypothetical protein